MKFFIFILLAGLAVQAAQTSKSLSTSTNEMSASTSEASGRSTTYSADMNVGFGTVVYTGGLSDGARDNFTVMTPKLTARSRSGVAFSLATPFEWSTGQGPDDTTRIIGRPILNAAYQFVNTENTLVGTDLSVRLPFIDISRGEAEEFRVWSVEPAVTVDQRLAGSRFHFIGKASSELQTDASWTDIWGSLNGQAFGDAASLTRPVVLREEIGLARETDWTVLSASLHFVNGLGVSHYRTSTFGSYVDEAYNQNQDINPIDISSLVLSASFKLADQTKLTALAMKGLKVIDRANSSAVYVSSLDRLMEVANVGLGLNLSQNF